MSLTNSEQEERRTYRSPLRDEQTAATHDRILEAVVRAMANGVAELSVPAVAHEAGVSVATVYRHFPNKQALLTELPDYFARQVRMDARFEPATTWDDFRAMLLKLFSAFDRFDEAARAAMVSQLGHEARQAQLPGRLQLSRASLANLAPELDDAALDRVNRLGIVVVSSSSFRMYKALGLTVEQTVDEAVWAIKAAIAAEAPDR